MSKGIYLALSGAVAESRALDNVAHNIANADTTGFHPQRMTFAEALDSADQRGTPPVAVSGLSTDSRNGSIRTTGNALDLAISGEGYFAIETARGVRYTRAGDFRLDAEGTLVTKNGEPVLDSSGARIIVPEGAANLAVGADGTIAADGEELGQIARVSFAAGALRAEDQVLAPVEGAIAGSASGEIVSGALERSSFDAVRGMVELIRVSRSYEALARMIEGHKQIDERTARAIGER